MVSISLGESRVGTAMRYVHDYQVVGEWYIRADTNWNKAWATLFELAMELLCLVFIYITVIQLAHDIFACIHICSS